MKERLITHPVRSLRPYFASFTIISLPSTVRPADLVEVLHSAELVVYREWHSKAEQPMQPR